MTSEQCEDDVRDSQLTQGDAGDMMCMSDLSAARVSPTRGGASFLGEKKDEGNMGTDAAGHVTVSRETTFEAAHRLRFHAGACRNVHGHSYRVRITAEAATNADGMVVDFSVLKRALAYATHGEEAGSAPRIGSFDHAIILHHDDALLEHLRAWRAEEPLNLIELTHEPTAEYMADLFARLCQQALNALCGPVDAPAVVRCEVWETANSCATWEAA